MQYRLKNDGSISVLNAEITGSDTIRIRIGENTVEATCFAVSEKELHIVVNARTYNAFVMRGESSGKTITINGIPYRIEDADLAEQKRKPRKVAGGIPQEITPPMPSVVERIMVTEGDAVKTGDGLVVVSAMKMETTLAAPFDCRVVKVNVSVGDKVMPGRILVDIERLPDEGGMPERSE